MMKYMILSMGSVSAGTGGGPFFTRHPRYSRHSDFEILWIINSIKFNVFRYLPKLVPWRHQLKEAPVLANSHGNSTVSRKSMLPQARTCAYIQQMAPGYQLATYLRPTNTMSSVSRSLSI